MRLTKISGYWDNEEDVYRGDNRLGVSLKDEKVREYFLQKEFENYKQEIESEIELMINQQDFGDKNTDLNNIKNAVEYLLVQNEEMKHLKSRVETVERGLQGIIFDKKSMVDNTENILALYREGRTIEEIVKELGIARRTVEFAIKLHKNNL